MTQKSKTYIPRISYNGKELAFKEVLLTVNASSNSEFFKCSNCDKEITKEQIKKTISKTKSLSSTQNEIIDKVLPYLNKYRKNFGLDTCLRKAHFIAQICHESANFKSLEEYEKWRYKNDQGKINNLPGIFSNTEIEFDETMGESLKDHLDKIFVLKDKDDKKIRKTNTKIKKILIDEKVKVVDKKLYTYYQDGEELLKTIKETIKKDGKDVEQVKYKVYLQNHKHFGVPLCSRAYKNRFDNEDELSRDGWKFKGRGLKQITYKSNYKAFSTYRNGLIDNKKSFQTDDIKIDFTEENNKNDLTEGNYLKLSNDPKFATQASLWFWIKGTPYKGKHAKEYADKDDSKSISLCINRKDTNSFTIREKYYLKARKKSSFDIVNHFSEMYDDAVKNNKPNQKAKAKEYFEKWAKKDKEADKKLQELRKVQLIKIESLPIKKTTIELKIDTSELKLIPLAPVSTSNSKKKKRRKRN